MSVDNTIFNKSYSKMAYSIRVISIIATALLLVVECGMIIAKILYGTIQTAHDLLDYVNRYIVSTASIVLIFDIAFLIGKFAVMRSERFEGSRVKKIFSLGHLCVLACTVTFVHYRIESVYALPIIVTFMSVVYADKVVTIVAAMYCSLAVTIGTIIHVMEKSSLTLDWYISYAIAILLYFITALIANRLIDIEQFKEKEQKKAHDKIDEVVISAELDALTRLWNYSKIEKVLKDKHFTRLGTKIAMLDIDNFKSVNDTYGHDFGNVVLRKLASILRVIQSNDIFAARYGGEEFCIIANQKVTSDKFRDLLEQIREEFACTEYNELRGSTRFTVSIGWAEIDETLIRYNERMGSECLRFADKALYVAKRSTKNRVVRFCEKEVYTAIEIFEAYRMYKEDPTQFSKQRAEEIKKRFEQIDKLNLKLATLDEYRETLEVVFGETKEASEKLFLLSSEIEDFGCEGETLDE